MSILQYRHLAQINREASQPDPYGHGVQRDAFAVTTPCRAYRPSNSTVLSADQEAISRIDLIEVRMAKGIAQPDDSISITDRRHRMLYEGFQILTVQDRQTEAVLTCRKAR